MGQFRLYVKQQHWDSVAANFVPASSEGQPGYSAWWDTKHDMHIFVGLDGEISFIPAGRRLRKRRLRAIVTAMLKGGFAEGKEDLDTPFGDEYENRLPKPAKILEVL